MKSIVIAGFKNLAVGKNDSKNCQVHSKKHKGIKRGFRIKPSVVAGFGNLAVDKNDSKNCQVQTRKV